MRPLRRRFLVVVLVLVAAWLAVAGFLFLVPRDDELPDRADAVVVLAGDADPRLASGLELVERGVADTLVLSREVREGWDGERLCAEGSPAFEVVCFDAEPYSTSGEAAAVRELAGRRDWERIVVATSQYHVFRTRLLFRRCLADRVDVVGTDYPHRWLPLILPLETGKLVWALTVDRGC